MIDTEVVSLYPFAFRTQEPPVGLREQGEKLVLVYIYDQNNLGGERKCLSCVGTVCLTLCGAALKKT